MSNTPWPDGRLVFSLSHEVLEDDELTTLTAARSMTLANGAAVSASAGLVAFEDGDVLPAFGLTYSQEILRGRTLTVALRQTGGENDDDEDILRTRFNAVYEQDLTRNSRFAVTGALASVDVQQGSTDDTLAASLGLSYIHDLTDDWALVARADHRITYEDGDRTDRSDVFSLNLERTFSFRP